MRDGLYCTFVLLVLFAFAAVEALASSPPEEEVMAARNKV